MGRKAKTPVVVPAGRLWPNTPSGAALEIEVFGATGEYKSGKTILGLTIAPGNHPAGHPFAGQPRTLYLDFEKSGGTYGGTGCHRVDVPAILLGIYGGKYTPLQVFEWFLNLIEQTVKAGQYDVIMADPITDVESGLVEFVKKNCDKFGLSPEQVRKAGGLLWGAVKDYWKLILLKLASKCKCFYYTSHLRDVWQGNTPTGKREPKGKETLMELSSLYLWLERKPDKDGKERAEPSGIVLKQRLADTFMDAAGALHVVNLMPPRLAVATVEAIRAYIANPPNYEALGDEEVVKEEVLAEETKLRMELARAEAERDTEASRLEQLGRRAELVAMANQAAASKPQPTDQTTQLQTEKEVGRQKAAKAVKEDAELALQKKEAEAKLVAAKEAEAKLLAGQTKEDGPVNAGGEAAAAPPSVPESGVLATEDQRETIRLLFPSSGLTMPRFKDVLAARGASSVPDMKREDVDELIAWIKVICEIRVLVGELAIAPDKLTGILARVGAPDIYALSKVHADALLRTFAKEKEKRAPAGN